MAAGEALKKLTAAATRQPPDAGSRTSLALASLAVTSQEHAVSSCRVQASGKARNIRRGRKSSGGIGAVILAPAHRLCSQCSRQRVSSSQVQRQPWREAWSSPRQLMAESIQRSPDSAGTGNVGAPCVAGRRTSSSHRLTPSQPASKGDLAAPDLRRHWPAPAVRGNPQPG